MQTEEAIGAGRLKVVTPAIIEDPEGRIFVAQRIHAHHLGDKGEFPGGKAEEGKTLERCLKREIQEELGVLIDEPKRFLMVDHECPNFPIRLSALKTKIVGGELHVKEQRLTKWVMPQEPDSIELAPVDMVVATAILKR